jgi:hypothetical protein
VSDGTVLVPAAADSKAAVPADTPTTRLMAGLKRRIEAACGKAAHDVEVIPESSAALQVCFSIRDRNDSDRLCAKIREMPELEPYQVSFQVQVDP